MNKVLHVFHQPEEDMSFGQTNSMCDVDVDDDAETEAFDTSGSSSDELEPDTTTGVQKKLKLLEDFPIVEEDSGSVSKNVFCDNQVASFVFFQTVGRKDFVSA